MKYNLPIFYAPDAGKGKTIELPEEEHRHLKVLRKTAGDALLIADGKGKIFEAEILSIAKKRSEILVKAVQHAEKEPMRLTLAVAPTKSNTRFEWIVEKATEMGVKAIIPLVAEHSERVRLNLDRLEKIALSAMKQSELLWLPTIEKPTNYADVLEMNAAQRMIAHCAEGEKSNVDAMDPSLDTLMLIGPEGDFSPTEIEQAIAKGFIPITLGDQRLRTETAAIVATTAYYLQQR